jgi:hypothetical protein
VIAPGPVASAGGWFAFARIRRVCERIRGDPTDADLHARGLRTHYEREETKEPDLPDSRYSSTRLLCALGAFCALLLATPAAAAEPRVVILGFDGADARLTEKWMDEGKLPNLARLRDQGTFAPLRSTIPSQTPVSWSTFATGLNPGRHSIFDFLKRDTETYRPSFAAFEEGRAPFLLGERNPLVFGLVAALLKLLGVLLVLKLFRVRTRIAVGIALVAAVVAGGGAAWIGSHWIPKERPMAINQRQGEPFWKTLGEAGKRVKVMRVPVTFPPEPFPHGEMLAGLGTPDLSGRIGKPFYFTSELFWQPRGGNEVSIEVVELIDNQGTIPAEIKGPPNKLFPDGPDYIEIPIAFTVAEDRRTLDIEVSGERLTLSAGEWSGWVRMTFPFNPLVRVHGIGRFRVLSIEPEVRVYLSPIQFDPSALPPVVEVTSPPELAGEMAEEFGLFKTIGWMIDTWSIKAGSIAEETFFQDVDFTVAADVEILEANLEADDWDVYMHYFEFTDRVQHVMWRHIDPLHPLYREDQAVLYGDTILESYQQMDEIVGRFPTALRSSSSPTTASRPGGGP